MEDVEPSNIDDYVDTISGTTIECDWFEPRGNHSDSDCSFDYSLHENIPASIEVPLEFYRLFLDEEVFNFMVTETNRNAQQVLRKELKQHSRLRSWTDTDANK